MTKIQRYFLIILLLSMACFPISAQSPNNTFPLKIFLYPKDGIVKIDTAIINFKGQQQPIVVNLPEGKYKLEAWAPRMDIQDTMITIRPKRQNLVRLRLKVTEDFEYYKTQVHEYNIKKALGYSSIGLGAAITFLTFDPILHKNYKSAKDRITMARLQYKEAIAPDVIENKAAMYNDALSDYNKIAKRVKRRRLIGIPVMLATYGFSVWSIRKIRKLSKPEYQYKSSPFSSIQLEPDFYSTAMGSVNGVSFKFNF